MTILSHENAVSETTPEEAVAAWQAAMERLQGRFDDVGLAE